MSKEVDAYILIAQQEWELNLGSNARNLAAEISKTMPVVYVNPDTNLKSLIFRIGTPYGRKRLKLALGIGENTIKIADNLWLHTPKNISTSINFLKNFKLYDILNKRNAKGFFDSLKMAVKKLGWKPEKCIVFNDSQMFAGPFVKEFFSPLLSFYYIRDNLVEQAYFKFHGPRIEPITIRDADAIFTNSAYLAEYGAKYNTRSSDIGQGCETDIYDAFSEKTEPADLAQIQYPRIGYVGFLTHERLDIQLLEQIAKARKNWQIVLIGPEDAVFERSRLHEIPNVHFLGSKKTKELPAYMHYMDVCMNPQVINGLTIGNYPRKIDEYLSMGKPTVATETLAMNMFLPHVELAVGLEGYLKAIEKALQPQTHDQKIAAINCAKSHTWEACVEKIFAVQEQLLNEKEESHLKSISSL
ncbi:glycosyltransferase [Emticicia sp. BO119]|uniref:glycosyltransferase n=1 Tax=Emticicia sp. BO119 TaxID=2757768 RepID=UPI0015F0C3B3|nr:glycosyltransferase [Emticicia sp. BO119]MBA4852672.1 glycosyltransferase [Emticicia sp. BO119]